MEKLKIFQPMLEYEAKLYDKLQGQPGFATVHWYGVEGEFKVLIIDLMGPSLNDLFEFCDRRFKSTTIMWLGTQMLSRIEAMHKCEFLHRDIKPENFLIGNSKKVNIVYAIDFGLSKRYIDPKTGNHLEHRKTKILTGTTRYCSVNAHKKFQQSRKDDLIGIGHILIYFYNNGWLPWMEAEESEGKKQKDYCKLKETFSMETLTKDCPQPIKSYMDYVDSLDFEQKPDYNFLKSLFDTYLKQTKFVLEEDNWDWD